jgi:hypothetical protein
LKFLINKKKYKAVSGVTEFGLRNSILIFFQRFYLLKLGLYNKLLKFGV